MRGVNQHTLFLVRKDAGLETERPFLLRKQTKRKKNHPRVLPHAADAMPEHPPGLHRILAGVRAAGGQAVTWRKTFGGHSYRPRSHS